MDSSSCQVRIRRGGRRTLGSGRHHGRRVGWVGGNFATPTDTLPVKVAVTVGHLIFPLALALLAGHLIASPASAAARRGVTAVAWLSVLFVVVSTGYALANPDPNAFGPHSFPD